MAYHGNNYLPLIWRFYVSHRSTLFRIVRVLTLTSTTQDQSLLTALTYMQSYHRTRREHIPATVDLSFASEQWQRTIAVKKRRKIMFARRHFEVCVFTYLAAESGRAISRSAAPIPLLITGCNCCRGRHVWHRWQVTVKKWVYLQNHRRS